MNQQPSVHTLTYERFMAFRPHAPCPDLVAARWRALTDAEQRQRITDGLELVWDDSIELDDDDASINDDDLDQPELWWTKTQSGRRAVEALVRLEVQFNRQRRCSDWAAAWATLEHATRYFAATVWLKDQPPLGIEQRPSEPAADHAWVDDLLARCDHNVELLVPLYLFEADPHALAQCYAQALTTADLLELPADEVDALRKYIRQQPADTSLVHAAVVRLGEHAWVEAEAAVETRDRDRIASAIRAGAAVLDVFVALIDSGAVRFGDDA